MSSSLKLWYNNVNGINSKKDSIEQHLSIDSPHIVILTETKTATLPTIIGYKWIAKNKPNNAGGVAIGARQDIANRIQEVDMEKENDMEIAWAKLKTNKTPIYLGADKGNKRKKKQKRLKMNIQYLTRIY